MKVYKLTPELVAMSGVYNRIWKFEPIEDADGNYVCGLADGENIYITHLAAKYNNAKK